jgi:hypothetical protein
MKYFSEALIDIKDGMLVIDASLEDNDISHLRHYDVKIIENECGSITVYADLANIYFHMPAIKQLSVSEVENNSLKVYKEYKWFGRKLTRVKHGIVELKTRSPKVYYSTHFVIISKDEKG